MTRRDSNEAARDPIPILRPDVPGPFRRARSVLFRAWPGAEARYHAFTNHLASSLYPWLRGDLPHAIELETLSACNGGCAFCPVNARTDPRPAVKMEMALVEKLASELAREGFAGHLALFSNNEPLLDERIVRICAAFRAAVPRAWIYLYTNGTRLTETLFDSLFAAGLDELVVTNYSDSMELRPALRRLLDALRHRPPADRARWAGRAQIWMRPESIVLTNRGGTAPNKQEDSSYRHYGGASCALPFLQMVVRPSGEISLCCQDALGQVTLGDLRTQTIREIWNGPEYERIRSRLRERGRRSLTPCDRCDAHLIQPQMLARVLRSRIAAVPAHSTTAPADSAAAPAARAVPADPPR
jgi:radical SAM protein with 4Fe4S-binding SPASM domain